MKDISIIPQGMYCYTPLENPQGSNYRYTIKPCPYWEHKPDLPEQESGYCSYLELGDADEGGTFLLWDMVKECGVNYDES